MNLFALFFWGWNTLLLLAIRVLDFLAFRVQYVQQQGPVRRPLASEGYTTSSLSSETFGPGQCCVSSFPDCPVC